MIKPEILRYTFILPILPNFTGGRNAARGDRTSRAKASILEKPESSKNFTRIKSRKAKANRVIKIKAVKASLNHCFTPSIDLGERGILLLLFPSDVYF